MVYAQDDILRISSLFEDSRLFCSSPRRIEPVSITSILWDGYEWSRTAVSMEQLLPTYRGAVFAVSSIAGRSHLRSAASGDLFIPGTNTVSIGPRAFAVACLAAWNSLTTETP